MAHNNPASLPHLLTASSPCDREEWAWLQSHVYTTANGIVPNLLSGEEESAMESTGLAEFIVSLRAAIAHLLAKLNIPLYRVKTKACECY